MRAILAIIALALLVLGCDNYDRIVEKDQACEQKWADVEANLQRRIDLVPNLVSVVRASAAHEEKVLKEVTEARAAATSVKLEADDFTDPAKMAAFQKAQDALKGSLSRLLAVNESYPDLKANSQMHDMMVELEGTENRLLHSREEYNKAVGDYNTEIGKIRGQIVNKATGKPFKTRVYFKASADAQAAPKVSF